MRVEVAAFHGASAYGAQGDHGPFRGGPQDGVEVESVADLPGLSAVEHDGDFRSPSSGAGQADEERVGYVAFADGGDRAVGDDGAVFVGGSDEAVGGVDPGADGAFAVLVLGDADEVVVGVEAGGVVGGDFAQARADSGGLVAGSWRGGRAVVAWFDPSLARGCLGGCGGDVWERVFGDDVDDAPGACGSLCAAHSDEVGVVFADGWEFPGEFGAVVDVVGEVLDAEVGAHFGGVEGAWVDGCGAWGAGGRVAGARECGGAVGPVEGFVGERCDRSAGARVDRGEHLPFSFQGMGEGAVWCSHPRGRVRSCGRADWRLGRVGRPGAGSGGRWHCPRGHRRRRHTHLRPTGGALRKGGRR